MDDGPVGVDGSAWEALPGRALEVLALACSARGRAGRSTEPPTAEAVGRLAAGVTALAEALDRPGPAPAEDAATVLRAAADLVAGLGEAARRVACAAGAAGQEPAAETADVVMCVALILRILAELGLRSVPPADAGGRPSR
ncbi:hypothetical protein [Actinomycetospora sp. TBRC 11914]|uniref:hypothetical protein n=1 Tax=Actinomycetospora sp. TBRC 11914 TaxID=2729387 RepID=UPI00145C9FE6|nr:hypothetical protein [Actinomycetospora sp. TBRC 11914]NMO92489.1 hypothetical protein [Actinomycetospora sp. TBRC 11914]